MVLLLKSFLRSPETKFKTHLNWFLEVCRVKRESRGRLEALKRVHLLELMDVGSEYPVLVNQVVVDLVGVALMGQTDHNWYRKSITCIKLKIGQPRKSSWLFCFLLSSFRRLKQKSWNFCPRNGWRGNLFGSDLILQLSANQRIYSHHRTKVMGPIGKQLQPFRLPS